MIHSHWLMCCRIRAPKFKIENSFAKNYPSQKVIIARHSLSDDSFEVTEKILYIREKYDSGFRIVFVKGRILGGFRSTSYGF